MLTPAAAFILLTSILASASPISAPASIANGLQITKPTASAIQFRRSHVNNHTSNAHIVRKDMERIRQKQSRRASLIAPKTGGAPPSKRDVTRAPKPFDIKAKRNGRSEKVTMIAEHKNGVDVSYYGTISIGTPSQDGTDPQEITVQFDTGSSDLVVPLTDCWTCPGPLFDPDESTTYYTYNTPFQIAYEDGSRAEGYIASDTVTLEWLTVNHQIFGAVYGAAGFDGPYAGVLGLGFPANAASGSSTFFGNLVASGILRSNLFSFYMSKYGAGPASELCLGCINPFLLDGETLNWHPIVKFTEDGRPLKWAIECTGISFTDSHWKSESLRASIDSGTDFIYVPKQVAKELYDQIPNSHPAEGDWKEGSYAYAFPCDSVGAFIFEFGEHEYTMYSWDMIAGHEDGCSDQCIGAIFGSDDQDDGTAVFGISFMQNLYSVFDYGGRRIGFAHIR